MEGDVYMEQDSLLERAICLDKRETALEEAQLQELVRRSSFETYKSDFRRSLENHGPFGSAVNGIGRGSSGYAGTFIENWSQPYGIARFEEFFDREKAAIRLEMRAMMEAANRLVEIARKGEDNRLAEIARKEEADRLAEIARKEEAGQKRELDQKEKAAHLVEIARQDEAVRLQEANNIEAKKKVTQEETRTKEKVDFTPKYRLQQDMTQWNNDMALGSKYRTDWSEAHNPSVSKDIVNDFIVPSYGIFISSKDQKDKAPRELIDLYAQLVNTQAKEPELLEQEGNLVDEEWMKLAKEREHWTSSRANMKLEDEMCLDEDTRYKQEHDYVRLEAEARQKKDRKGLEANDEDIEPFLQAFGEMVMFGGEYVDVDVNACYNVVVKWNLDVSTEKMMSNEAEALQDAAWKAVCSPNPGPPRCSHQVVVYRDHLYVFGGEFAAVDHQKLVQHVTRRVIEKELDQGHTGTDVSHLGATLYIRDNPHAITSTKESRTVPMVGDKHAAHIGEEQVTEKLKDATLDPKESLNFKDYQRPELVVDIYKLRARGRENQVLMDEFANVGEHEIFLGSSGKGTSHFRAAREIQLADQVIKSDATDRAIVRLVCDLMTDEHGWIVKNSVKTTRSNSFSRGSGGGYTQAYIVNDLREESVVCQEKQFIVDVSIDYGDSHVYSGYQDKGISRLRATQHIWDSKTVVKSGQQASKEIDVVGQRVAANVDQGHADRDEDCGYDPRNQEMEEVTVSRDITKNEAQAWKWQVEVSQKWADGLKEIHVENAINLVEPRDRDKVQVLFFKQVWNVNEMSSMKVEGYFRSGYKEDVITDAVDGKDAWRLKEIFPEFIVETKTHIPLWIY